MQTRKALQVPFAEPVEIQQTEWVDQQETTTLTEDQLDARLRDTWDSEGGSQAYREFDTN